MIIENHISCRNARILIRVLLFTALLAPVAAKAQRKPPELDTRILFLFDASQSMYARWESDIKYEVARKLLSEMVDSLQQYDNLELALRVYGHTKRYPPQDCDDTRLEVPFGKRNGSKIKQRLQELKPSGTTPIARALEECGQDFPKSPARNIIILITDGIEECNGDPCAVSAMLQRKGVVLKPFVIGLGLGQEFLKTLECVGNFFDATREDQFRKAFDIVITQALNNTTAQVNLLDIYGKPSETNVNMTFYDTYSGQMRYNIMHTINNRGVPDTIQIDPLGQYNLLVHTLPPVRKDSIGLLPGKHNVIGVDAPQGDLLLKIDGGGDYKKLQAIVRKHKETQTLHVQGFDASMRYLIGDYDLEILTVPRIYVEKVNISQSKTTTIQIPSPGLVTLNMNAPGYGDIFLEEQNQMKWVYRLSLNTIKESFILQPGLYRVVFRPKNSPSSIYTIEKTFRIVSGSSISININ